MHLCSIYPLPHQIGHKTWYLISIETLEAMMCNYNTLQFVVTEFSVNWMEYL